MGIIKIMGAMAVASLLSLQLHAQTAINRFNLPSQPLSESLKTVAAVTNVNVLFDADEIAAQMAPALSGNVTVDQALTTLLAGSGLKPRYLDEKTVVLERVRGRARTSSVAGGKQGEALRMTQAGEDSASQEKAGNGKQDGVSNAEGSASRESSELQEVVVTAQKKVERLRDVPVPVSVLDADALLNNNQTRLQDYYSTIPGLNLTSGFFGESQVGIRGIKQGFYDTPTVGVVIDDVPVTATTGSAGGWLIPDIDPSNLTRIEVLRGPQGTLYGASSMGGLIKYVTVDPSTDRVSGRVQVGTTGVTHGNGLGYNARATINVPLSDTMAIRASAFTRREPGYVDQIYFGDPSGGRRDDVNRIDVRGGQLSALWRPTESLSLKLNALLQHMEIAGSPYVNTGLGDLQQIALRGTGWYQIDSRIYSATLKAKLQGAELTVLSGFTDTPYKGGPDYTFPLGGLSEALLGVQGSPFIINGKKHTKLTQEVRLSRPFGERFEGLLGAFYTKEDSKAYNPLRSIDPATGVSPGILLIDDSAAKYGEYAAFTNLTVRFTGRFDFQVGGRQSHQWQSSNQRLYGAIIGDPSGQTFVSVPSISPKSDAFTYLVTPRFKITSDLMLYARLASGYRPGGSNDVRTQTYGLPGQYGPDKTLNYEIGFKGNALKQALSFDASVYYIDWKDIQTAIAFTDIGGYTTNIGRAKSQGVELSVETRPVSGLSISAWLSWNDAVVTKDLPFATVPVFAGDRLPYAPRWSGNFAVDQDFPVTSHVSGFVGASVSYVGDRRGVFGAAPRDVFGAYAKTDLRAGVRYDAWTLNMFATNLTDRRGVLTRDLVLAGDAAAANYIQPRAFGISVTRGF